jgi:hypothetical protein
MSESHPYREAVSSSWQEEELWLSLDCALVEAMRDTSLAWAMAWNVLLDAQALRIKAVEVAATSLLHELSGGLPPDWLLPQDRLDIPAAPAAEELEHEHVSPEVL